RLRDKLYRHLEQSGSRRDLTEDLDAQDHDIGARYRLARAWFEALVEHEVALKSFGPVVDEAAALVVTDGKVDLDPSTAITEVTVEGLLGQHSRIENGVMRLRLDEFVGRLSRYHD